MQHFNDVPDALDRDIDRYIAGEMSAPEVAAFLERVQHDGDAMERLAAEHLIERYYATPVSKAEGTLPAPALIAALSGSRRRRPLGRWLLVIAFGLVLSGALLLLSLDKDSSLSQEPHHASAVQNNVPDTGRRSRERAVPLHELTARDTALPHRSTDSHSHKGDYDFDERLPKPRVFIKDSTPLTIRTR